MLIAGALGANIVACGNGGGGGGPKLGERIVPIGQPAPKGGGVYKIGAPYELNGVWYKPGEDGGYDRTGTASWYGELFHGRRTANGEIFDMERLSAASPTLPMPVYAKVTNLENGRSLVVRVNDRGPYRSNRVIDLSRRSAELLGFRNKGTARVRVQYLGRAPMSGDDSYERRHLASQPWARYAMRGESPPTREEPVAVASVERSNAGARKPRQRPSRAIVSLMAEEEQEYPARDSAAPRPVSDGRLRTIPVRSVSIQPPATPPAQSSATRAGRGIVIVAGSFKNRDNADRARDVLGEIANVEIAPLTIGGEIFFRVRVGPFADREEAGAALSQVTQAGYTGARLVAN